jgi:hypothetical protein
LAPAPGSLVPSMAFAKSTQARHPRAPPRQEVFTTLQTSLHCCGPARCSTPLRTRPLDRTRELRYRGLWRLLGPVSYRLADENLSLGYVMIAPLQASRQVAGRTGVEAKAVRHVYKARSEIVHQGRPFDGLDRSDERRAFTFAYCELSKRISTRASRMSPRARSQI